MASSNALCTAWFFALLIAEPIEEAHQYRLIERSRSVQIGMTPDETRAVLGEPDAEYERRGLLTRLLLGPRPKQWVYGTTLNLDYLIAPGLPFPDPFPLNLRIFDFAAEDLVIDWSSEDMVSSLRRPQFEVPEVADDMLEAVYFVTSVLRVLAVEDR